MPRTTEGVVRARVRFRIGRIVYLGFSADEELMGFAFPKEEREALVASEPGRIHAPPTRPTCHCSAPSPMRTFAKTGASFASTPSMPRR